MNRKPVRGPVTLLLLLLIGLLAFPAGAGAAPAAVLSGAVTAENGRPLAGARVEVFQYGQGLVVALAAGPDGRFATAVPDLGDRLFWVRVWAGDHETAEQVWVRGQETSLRIALAPLYGSVAGWVEGSDGSPVEGARVELVHPSRPALVTTATHEGRFWFERVPAAEGYWLRASGSGWAPAVKEVGRVEAEAETSLSLSLQTFQGQVTGAVVDRETGAALRQVAVAVEQVGLGIVATATTDAGGAFTASLPAVAGATYRVHARLAHYRPAVTDPFALDSQGRARLDGGQRVKLAPLAADLIVRVLDSDGDPLPGAPLWLERDGVGIVAAGVTDKDGSYRFAGVPAGSIRYRVRLVAEEMQKRGEEHNWEAAASEWVTPVPGQWLSLGLPVVRGYLHDYGEGEILGRVTGPDQRPVAGARVELIRAGEGVVATAETAEDGTYWFEEVEANLPETETGSRMMRPREPGTGYVVRVRYDQFHPAASQVVDLANEQQVVADLTLADLRSTAVVHVTDQEGRPVEGAAVRLYPAEGGESALSRTDTAGTARVDGRVLGAYWLEVEREGHHKALVSPVLLTSGQDTVIDVTLGAIGGTLYGSVTDSLGRPVSQPLTVTALAADGREIADTVRPDGSFALSGLMPGAPALVSLRDGAEILAAPAQVVAAGAGQRARIDLTVSGRSGSVRGQVTDESGQPAAGVTVSLVRSGDGVVAAAITDAHGFYRFDGLPTGTGQRYAVRVDRTGYGYRQVGHRMPPPLFLLADGEARYVDLVVTPLR